MRMFLRPLVALTLLAGGLAAQDPRAAAPPTVAPNADGYTLDPGTKVPLNLINSISTKHSQQGDRVYLETAFPVLANGRIVIPVGSWVAGTVTEVKKPGRVKGRGELYIRFDTLTLPNGVTRDLRSRMDSMDASSTGELDRSEGKVKSEGNKAGDLKTVAETTGAGASVGAIAGHAAGHGVMGLGIGAAAGMAGGLIYTLVSRGPDAVIAKGSTVEMVLDRPIVFNENDVNFTNALPRQNSPLPGSADKGGV
jgi:type IV secretion system protein VirB10